jgi:hypothetical protein
MELKIECDGLDVDTIHYDNQVRLTLRNPNFSFIQDVEVEDIISNVDNEKLFEAIIKNDDEILHNYLTASGYIFNKA